MNKSISMPCCKVLFAKPLARDGFTIVELLIVIIVIAILAAISIVAYNGIQNRAYNTKVIAGVNTYYKAFLQYKTINGSYPSIDGCLGANYPNNACWASDSAGTSASYVVNSTLDTNLNEFIKNKPELGGSLLFLFANTFRVGLVYINNDTTYGNRLSYYIKGNNGNCSLAVAAQLNEGALTQCIITLPN